MSCKENPRVQELMKINRMIHPIDLTRTEMEGEHVRGLADFVDDIIKPNFVMCEIGSYMGISSELFALYVKKIYCVDNWDPSYCKPHVEEMFDRMSSNYDNLVKIKKNSDLASKEFEEGTLDLIYIDADHSEEGFRADMENWVPKVNSSGIVAGHDYGIVAKWLIDYVDLGNVKVFDDMSWYYLKTNSLTNI